MHIVQTDRFLDELEEILFFIADDSLEQALSFQERLDLKLNNLTNMPYKNRKSLKADDENIRDMIFQGYVIPYRIKTDSIQVLGIFSQNEWEM